MAEDMLLSILEQMDLQKNCLSEKVALVTGAGGGIGFQAARSLLCLGASVIIAEINKTLGKEAEKKLSREFGESTVRFIHTDVGSRSSVRRLLRKAQRSFAPVDILINNATIAPLGKVVDTPIDIWDASYRVNLRGPVLLIQGLLPEMLNQDTGVIINVSSTGTAFMGAYETFKSAQVHLTETLDAELEGSNVVVLTLGPGLVPTATATNSIEKLAPEMGLSLEEFYRINKNAILSVEEAGAGFASAVVYARKFRGQEISAMQALLAAGYQPADAVDPNEASSISKESQQKALALAESVYKTFQTQTTAWQERSIFERQWMLRDFKKNAGMPVDAWRERLESLLDSLREKQPIAAIPLENLSSYYTHLADLAKGYTKDPDDLQENLTHIFRWKQEVDQLLALLRGK